MFIFIWFCIPFFLLCVMPCLIFHLLILPSSSCLLLLLLLLLVYFFFLGEWVFLIFSSFSFSIILLFFAFPVRTIALQSLSLFLLPCSGLSQGSSWRSAPTSPIPGFSRTRRRQPSWWSTQKTYFSPSRGTRWVRWELKEDCWLVEG